LNEVSQEVSMRLLAIAGLVALLVTATSDRAPAQLVTPDTPLRISWEVKNRFRMFRNEADFQRHLAAERGDGVLGAERRLAQASGGYGWARLTLNALCVDAAGQLMETCERDGTRESYLAPTDHRVGVMATNAPAGATCTWRFESVDHEPQQASVPCAEEVRLRVPYGRPTVSVVEVAFADGTAQRATAEILVRDLLIAGIGDSIASGEGNPDRAIALDDGGFCFRRFLGTARSEYFRPGRAGFAGNRTCETTAGPDHSGRDWAARGANWMSAACHRSLYGYQLRAALALAVENREIAVTFLPLACTGAGIEGGLLASRRARELTCGGRGRAGACPSTVPAQIAQMATALKAAQRVQPGRTFDLVLLTVGANDVYFSELVANAILDQTTERTLLAGSGGIATAEDARAALQTQLPTRFAKLRSALKPLIGGDLARVVFVSYPNPTLYEGGAPCPGGRDGVDVHPAFAVNADRVREASIFVERQFLPAMRALALCESGAGCRDAADRMTFVDAHQGAFADRGFCARGEADPEFDKACFSLEGASFEKSNVSGAERPLVCELSVRQFRPYAARERWIRTANDSYFTSMTYPDGMSGVPADIHDAMWGVLSAVYGGAIHPTAEGHAAMADAALPAAREVLRLIPSVAPIHAEPLAPPPGTGAVGER
jgi:lysophospholipase L1-like esterase